MGRADYRNIEKKSHYCVSVSSVNASAPLVTNSSMAREQELELQFWLLGRDVNHPGGNLLLRAGFIPEPPPAKPPARTRYRLGRGSLSVVL